MRRRKTLNVKQNWTRLALFLACLILQAKAQAAPLTLARNVTQTDWIQAGISGVGDGALGANVNIAGVSGTVNQAFLYVHGLSSDLIGPGGTGYTPAGVTFDGNPISLTSIGTTSPNCWGVGSSTLYRADVTSLVNDGTPNGNYSIGNLANCTACNVNGASMVVLFDDGNAANNHNLVFYEGNDADTPGGIPGEFAGWNVTMPGLQYLLGTPTLTLHVADGQSGGDGNMLLTLSPNVGGTNPLLILDTPLLFEGSSLPTAGRSRLVLAGGVGNLYDIHTFDLSVLFNSVPGTYSLALAQNPAADCLALAVAIVDLPAAQLSTPTPTRTPSITPTSTLSPTVTSTNSATAIPSPSSTPTSTSTGTATSTPTPSFTPTSTLSPTVTRTNSATATSSPTSTSTSTSTRTATPTPTLTSTPSFTPTSTSTSTSTRTATPTPTLTSTPSFTPTSTLSPTVTRTNSATATPSPTSTFTSTPSFTPTSTLSPTSTSTGTATPTPTPTSPPSFTPTSTSTRTSTRTATPTPTPTNSPPFTPTSTFTITSIRTATPPPTPTSPPSFTPTPTPSASPTATQPVPLCGRDGDCFRWDLLEADQSVAGEVAFRWRLTNHCAGSLARADFRFVPSASVLGVSDGDPYLSSAGHAYLLDVVGGPHAGIAFVPAASDPAPLATGQSDEFLLRVSSSDLGSGTVLWNSARTASETGRLDIRSSLCFQLSNPAPLDGSACSRDLGQGQVEVSLSWSAPNAEAAARFELWRLLGPDNPSASAVLVGSVQADDWGRVTTLDRTEARSLRGYRVQPLGRTGQAQGQAQDLPVAACPQPVGGTTSGSAALLVLVLLATGAALVPARRRAG